MSFSRPQGFAHSCERSARDEVLLAACRNIVNYSFVQVDSVERSKLRYVLKYLIHHNILDVYITLLAEEIMTGVVNLNKFHGLQTVSFQKKELEDEDREVSEDLNSICSINLPDFFESNFRIWRGVLKSVKDRSEVFLKLKHSLTVVVLCQVRYTGLFGACRPDSPFAAFRLFQQHTCFLTVPNTDIARLRKEDLVNHIAEQYAKLDKIKNTLTNVGTDVTELYAMYCIGSSRFMVYAPECLENIQKILGDLWNVVNSGERIDEAMYQQYVKMWRNPHQ